jgi:ketosteroid isomerase-like protein
MGDDYSEISAGGEIINKAAVLAAIPNYTIESSSVAEISARAFGNTAIMTLRNNSKGTYQGNDVSGEYRETIVWVKRDGRWQMVACQVTRIPSK